MQRCLELIKAVEGACSAESMTSAVKDLAQSDCKELAIPTLIEVLNFNNPAAAAAAVEGLIAAGEPAVEPLLSTIDGHNYTARAWSVRALASIADPRALTLLLDATQDFSFSVRRAAAKGLGQLQWNQLPLEKQFSAQWEALNAILTTLNDSEWVVRYASIVGLEQIALTLINSPSTGKNTLSAKTDVLDDIFQGLEERRTIEKQAILIARINLAKQRLNVKTVTPA